jgi:molybdenum cofactor biosynthesis enzyme MoaA
MALGKFESFCWHTRVRMITNGKRKNCLHRAAQYESRKAINLVLALWEDLTGIFPDARP